MFQKLLRHQRCLNLEGLIARTSRSLLIGRHASSSSSATATAQSPKPSEEDQINEHKNVAEGNRTHFSDSQDSDKPNQGGSKESKTRGYMSEQEEAFTPYRWVYPEFLPDVNPKYRHRIREKLERMDMLKRRSNIEIPEFYVGSILSVTVSDRNAPGKTNTFVGICTERDGNALRTTFTLRNVVDGHGVEICYDLYNPTILNITCLRLEKRLDDNLRYLRDALPEYSTFPFDMVPELRAPDAPVPINTIKVKMNPKPWTDKWHLWDLQGVEDDLIGPLEKWQVKKYKTWKFQTGYEVNDMDLMKTYRETIPAEEQTEIYSEVHQQLEKLTASLRKQKKKKTFAKPQKVV